MAVGVARAQVDLNSERMIIEDEVQHVGVSTGIGSWGVKRDTDLRILLSGLSNRALDEEQAR